MNIPEDVAKTIESVQFQPPPGTTIVFRQALNERALQASVYRTDEVKACRIMMKGTPEEQAFARANHDARLVQFIEWELTTPDEKPTEGYELFGAVDGERL